MVSLSHKHESMFGLKGEVLILPIEDDYKHAEAIFLSMCPGKNFVQILAVLKSLPDNILACLHDGGESVDLVKINTTIGTDGPQAS